MPNALIVPNAAASPAAGGLLYGSLVGISSGHAGYGSRAPFSPSVRWPEYPFGGSHLSTSPNPAYTAVRSAIKELGLDSSRCGSAGWNPLRGLVWPGDTVVVKPNFVHHRRQTLPGDGECLITHGSVIRAVLDYVFLAMGGRGRIVIADAPQDDADFGAIRRISELDGVRAFYRDVAGFDVEVYDLRSRRARKIDGVIVEHEELAGDPAGYTKVDLGRASAFAEVGDLCNRLYGSDYDVGEVRRHQHGDVHEYLICRTVLDADCVVSVPKLKTHKKVGLTVNMKNLVGINGNKNWLPHYREGTPTQGGDQFAEDRLRNRLERSTVATFKRVFPRLGPLRAIAALPVKALGRRLFGSTDVDTIRSGNWHGNDTAWRMVMDLARILLYADSSGRLHQRPFRRFFSVVDGIIAGEGNGPLDASPKLAGVVLAGTNPLAVDLACARAMGFDYRRLPVLSRAFEPHPYPLSSFGPDEVRCNSSDRRYDGPVDRICALGFKPHVGWAGHVELSSVAAGGAQRR